MTHTPRIAIIGLGYVGLPLAVAMSRRFDVTGLDIDRGRVARLNAGIDDTGEVESAELAATAIRFTTEPEALRGAEVYIITVPTPVTLDNKPDLGAVVAACRTVGQVMASGAVVVLESTVYPGVTEEVCGPEIEAASGLAAGRDFFLGYSPERINPGDREHKFEHIVKVVAGQTPEVTERLAKLYGAVTSGGVFVARNIKTAEAAKVIENAQRDINIAFINEVTTIFNKLGLSAYDVLDAAGTKWNFLPFTPGLVGGHCIGVDPYYLADCAVRLGQIPEVILAGRRINDGMGGYFAACICDALAPLCPDAGRVLVLGLTFKENVPDLRNTQVVAVIQGLRSRGHEVLVHDPLANSEQAKALYGVDLLSSLDGIAPVNCVVGAVAHTAYRTFGAEDFAALLTANGLVADLKAMWRGLELPGGLRRWQP